MQIRDGIVDAIGNTPLIKLERASAATGCTILGKAEFMNPGQSVKDRAGRQMILEAEKRGELKPGGLVVEGTAGNTGIGLALVANARGYRTLIVIPEHPEPGKEGHAAAMRRRARRGAGAALQQSQQLPAHRAAACRAAPQDREERRAVRRPVEQPRQPQGALRLDRPGNLAARPTARSTASSARSAPAARSPASRPICARRRRTSSSASPIRAALRCTTCSPTARRRATEGGSITEGIGLGRVTPIIDDIKVEKPYLIPDEEAVPIIFDLLEHEGLCLGGSSGINVAGAIRLAKDLGPGHTIVTVLCRLRHALPVQAVQPGIPALEEPAGAGLARAQAERRASRSRRSERAEFSMPTDCLFRDDSYLKDCERDRRRDQPRRRHRARPHRVLRRLRRPAGRPRHA